MKIGTGKDILLIWLCTMKQSDMFKLKNILDKSVYCVICSFVAFNFQFQFISSF